MVERLSPGILRILREAGIIAKNLGCKVYLVGGMLRDLLLCKPNQDLDLVVVGDGFRFAHHLAAGYSGTVKINRKFLTAVVFLPEGARIDVATARKEFYSSPAALPEVKASNLREDLYRRDFTINTLAVELNPERFGTLVDFFGGCSDLKKGVLRVLHDSSFLDDPTRILRAVRFENSLGMVMEPKTYSLAGQLQVREALSRVSGSRLWAELHQLLALESIDTVLRKFCELGLLEAIFHINIDEEWWNVIGRVPAALDIYRKEFGCLAKISLPLFHLAVIYHFLAPDLAADRVRRFNLKKHEIEAVSQAARGKEILKRVSSLPRTPGELHKTLSGLPPESILAISAQGACLAIIRDMVKYLKKREELNVEVSGEDLKELGIQPGPEYSTILKKLEYAYLDGKLKNRREALDCIRGLLAHKGS